MKRDRTPGPWEITLAKRNLIGQIIAALANQDEAIVVNGPRDKDNNAQVIAIFPTSTRKPTREDYGNAQVVAESGEFLMKLSAIAEEHPEAWARFKAEIEEAKPKE